MLDYTGKSADKLKEKTLYLLDMDGTIYNENQIFDGTLEFLEEIKRRGGQYVFITNNSSKSVEDYVQKVQAMGIEAEYENFYTSSQATAMYLKENYPNQVVYCMGTKSLIKELREAGIEVVTEVDDRASVVLLGFDTENTSEKIRNTCIMLGRDVAYLVDKSRPCLSCEFWLYSGLWFNEYHVKKCYRKRTIFYWKTRADYGELCIETIKLQARKCSNCR